MDINTKFETLNPKLETLNKSKIQNPKFKIERDIINVLSLEFCVLSLFRI